MELEEDRDKGSNIEAMPDEKVIIPIGQRDYDRQVRQMAEMIPVSNKYLLWNHPVANLFAQYRVSCAIVMLLQRIHSKYWLTLSTHSDRAASGNNHSSLPEVSSTHWRMKMPSDCLSNASRNSENQARFHKKYLGKRRTSRVSSIAWRYTLLATYSFLLGWSWFILLTCETRSVMMWQLVIYERYQSFAKV